MCIKNFWDYFHKSLIKANFCSETEAEEHYEVIRGLWKYCSGFNYKTKKAMYNLYRAVKCSVSGIENSFSNDCDLGTYPLNRKKSYLLFMELYKKYYE